MSIPLNDAFIAELAALFDKMDIQPLIIIGKDKGNGKPRIDLVGPYPLGFYRAALDQAVAVLHHATDDNAPSIILPPNL